MAEAPHYIFQAFPSISTGIYSYPMESATHVALGEVRKFLDTEDAKEACLVYIAIPALGACHLRCEAPTVRARDLHGVFRGGRGRVFVSVGPLFEFETPKYKGHFFWTQEAHPAVLPMERPCAALSEISYLIQNCGRKRNGVERKTSCHLARWYIALGAVSESVVLRLRNSITMYVLLYRIHVKKSRVDRRDRPSAGGLFVRLISTKFIEDEILQFVCQLDWKLPLHLSRVLPM